MGKSVGLGVLFNLPLGVRWGMLMLERVGVAGLGRVIGLGRGETPFSVVELWQKSRELPPQSNVAPLYLTQIKAAKWRLIHPLWRGLPRDQLG